jgi:hypothetical protein
MRTDNEQEFYGQSASICAHTDGMTPPKSMILAARRAKYDSDQKGRVISGDRFIPTPDAVIKIMLAAALKLVDGADTPVTARRKSWKRPRRSGGDNGIAPGHCRRPLDDKPANPAPDHHHGLGPRPCLGIPWPSPLSSCSWRHSPSTLIGLPSSSMTCRPLRRSGRSGISLPPLFPAA